MMACFDLCQENLMRLRSYKPERLQINSKRYYRMVDFPNVPPNLILPSVTTVASACAPVGKIMALINWRKRVGDEEANRRTRLATDRGTWLHGVLEDLWNGEDFTYHLERCPEFAPYFQAVEGFVNEVRNPMLVESAVGWFSPELEIGFSGTFDMLACMENGAIALVDWKTSYKKKSNSQLADYKMQLGSYTMALEQMYGIEIEKAYCVIAVYDPESDKKKSELQLIELDQNELVCHGMIMEEKTKQFFAEHYPGGKPFRISEDRG
jgi:genome maintenance exonuclease 1